MPNTTVNLNLEKPLQTENYDVDVFNSNCDKIDGFVNTINDKINSEVDQLNNKIDELIPKLGNRRLIFRSNSNWIADDDYNLILMAVAAGGGGCASTGCGGGSGQSLENRIISIKKNDSINMIVGIGGKGNTYVRDNSLLPQGGECNGLDGTNTVITITKTTGTEVITLIGGKGAIIGSEIFDYNGGVGEQHGQLMSINTWNSATEDTWWVGGAGGNSIFGAGSMGGNINPFGKSVNASHSKTFGAGGGGSGIRRHGTSNLYTWNSAGNGFQGVVILDLK